MIKNLGMIKIVGGLTVIGVILVVAYLFASSNGPAPSDTDTVVTITPTELREVKSITAVDDLNDAVYVESKDLYYISSFDENKVYAVNSARGEIEGEIPLDAPNRMLFDEQRQVLYVASGTQVAEVNISTFQPQRFAAVGRRPLEMVLADAGRYLYVVNEFSNTVSVVDVEKFELVDTLAVGRRPVDIAIDRNGYFIYVANKDDATLTKISVANRSVVGLITNVGRPIVVEAYPTADLMLVLDQYNDQLLVLDQADDTVVRKIGVVDYPSAIAFDLESDRLFVSSFTQSSIAIVDLDAEKMTQQLNLGSAFEPVSGLNNMLYNETDRKLLLTNTNTGNVYFVPVN